MKHQNLSDGKKSDKKQLRSITGGGEIGIDMTNGEYKKYGPFCGELQCKIIP